MLSSELFDDRYVVYRRDRETTGFHCNKDGGGVLIAVSRKINSKCNQEWQSKCEDLWITIDASATRNSQQIVLCAVYLPPPVCQSTVEHFIENCNNIFESINLPVCIIGDFNLSKLSWEPGVVIGKMPNTCQLLLDFMHVTRLVQHNNVKNCSGRILDLILTTIPSCSVNESNCSLTNIDKLHPPLEITLSLIKDSYLPYNKFNFKSNFYKANYDQIKSELNKQNWSQLFESSKNVNSMLEVFYGVLNHVIDKFVPKCKSTTSRYPPWFDKVIIKSLKEKNRLRIRFKKYKNPRDKIELILVTKRCESMAKSLYQKYMANLEAEINKNPKLFWSHIKTKRGGTSAYPLTMTDGLTTSSNGPIICNLFAKYFSSVYTPDSNLDFDRFESDYLSSLKNSQCLTIPVIESDTILNKLKSLNICKGAGPDGIPPFFIAACASALVIPLKIIYNTSLTTGIFPAEWKKAKVVPVFKSDKKDCISNYRPISILSTFAKVFESMICPHVQRHFNLYLSDHQHGFVASRSTTTNLLTFTEFLVQCIDANKQCDVVYTDFSKAFDKISHSILVYKLSLYGVTGFLLKWLASYLAEREFYVVVNGFRSETFSITSGAPQGAHLASVLFNIFVNDLPHCFQYSNCFLYADDLKFARCIESSHDAILLQEDLDRLFKWCTYNRMELNIKKCYYISFSRKMNHIRSEYMVDNKKINKVDKIKDLGVLFDDKLTFIPHMEQIITKASKMLGFVIRNTRSFKQSSTKIMLYNSLVRSILEYCSVVWRPHYATHMLRLERVQKRFLWHLAFSQGKSKCLPSYHTRLRYFRMLPLSTRANITDAFFFYKLIRNKIDCPTLLALFRFRAPTRLPRGNVTPLYPPLRRTVLGANSAIPRLCKIINSCSDVIDIHHDSIGKFIKSIIQLCSEGCLK